MQHPQRFTRAVQALVQAYFDGTLVSTDCKACAVGNMVAAGYGLRIKKETNTKYTSFTCDEINDAWAAHFICGERNDAYESKERLAKGHENIRVTGYSMEELMRVELTLLDVEDDAQKAKDPDPTYTALLAVIDVLREIEGITDAQPTKALFSKPTLAEADI